MTCYEDDLDLCFSTHCMTAMRKWLKEEYGTLAALNNQWSASFRNWDDVTPDDTYEAQARGNYSSWADHRTFMEKTYAECVEFALDELKRLTRRRSYSIPARRFQARITPLITAA